MAACIGLYGCNSGATALSGIDTEASTSNADEGAFNDSEDSDDAGGNSESGSLSPAPDVPACGNGVLDGDEECDLSNFGDRSCVDYGATGGSLRCTDDCRIDECGCEWEFGGGQCGPSVCGNGRKEAGEDCDGADLYDDWDEDVSCADEVFMGRGELGCTADCRYDLSECTSCGDGILDAEYEECDGAPLGVDGGALTCAEHFGGGYAGVTTCSKACEIQSDQCISLCGNGLLDDGEVCDGEASSAECADFGFEGGTLGCTSDCQITTSGCDFCGNGVLDDGEVCDGDAFSEVTCATYIVGGTGTLGCTATCGADTSACEPGGGLLVISEVMIAPAPAPLFSGGEWIEFHNPDPQDAFPLAGCTMSGTAAFETADLDPTLSIPPGGYITLGKGSLDELGFEPDGMLAPQSTFSNEADVIRIHCGETLVDEVDYDDTDPWPEQAPGASIVLQSLDVGANDLPSNWCLATTAYDDLRFGTPGAPGGCE